VDQFLPVAMILLGLVGAVWVIVLGIQYGKAESDDVKTEAKKKLINTIVGVCIGLLIMIVLAVWLKNSEAIAQWLRSGGVA
jgi:cell division protein FtsW (lipid II flippase)